MNQVRLSVRLRKIWPLMTTSRGPPRFDVVEEIFPRQLGMGASE